MTPGCPGRLGRQGTVALSDHPVWLPPLRHSNPADHSHDRVVPSWRLQMEAASTSGFAGAFRLNATVPPTLDITACPEPSLSVVVARCHHWSTSDGLAN